MPGNRLGGVPGALQGRVRVEAVGHVESEVRELIRRTGLDPSRDTRDLDRLVRDAVADYDERSLHGGLPTLPDLEGAVKSVLDAVAGFGPLQKYFDDPEIEEIWINEPSRVFVARGGVAELTNTILTEDGVRDLVERMLKTSGRRVDLSSPFVDASLPDGSRLHVAIPDVTRARWAVNIRKFRRNIRSLTQLVELDSLTRQAAEFLRMSVLAGANILVSGATHTGKTTMLNALMSAARNDDRVVTVEETFELDLDVRDLVSMQCRQPSLEGTGEITLRRLIKEALRMRPDRLVVGEVREAESLDLLIALNSGLPGMCTIHANSAQDALVKLCTLPLLAGRNIDSAFVVPTVASCIDLVVHLGIDRGGARRVLEISAPTGATTDAAVEAELIFSRRGGELVPTGRRPARTAKFVAAGLDPEIVLSGGVG